MKFLLILSVLLLSGCYGKTNSMLEREYNWAVNFCGSKEKIREYIAREFSVSGVSCTDGRVATIPFRS